MTWLHLLIFTWFWPGTDGYRPEWVQIYAWFQQRSRGQVKSKKNTWFKLEKEKKKDPA